MKSNISSMSIYLQMNWHFEAGSTGLVGSVRIVSMDLTAAILVPLYIIYML